MSPDLVIHVLVVEDDFLSRSHAVNLVEDAGFTAIEASNADEAIAILERRKDIRINAGLNGWPQTGSCHPQTLAADRTYCHFGVFQSS